MYFVYQEIEFYRTEVRECRVVKAVFEYYCEVHSRTATLDAKLLPRNVKVSPEDCEEAFNTGKLRIDQEATVNAENGKIMSDVIYRGGEIGPNGDCTGQTQTRKNNLVNNVVTIEDYQIELRTYEATFDAATGKMTQYPKCNAAFSTCVTSEATIIYKARKDYCELKAQVPHLGHRWSPRN